MVENSPLGKETVYLAHYSPDQLFPISRAMQREKIGLKKSDPLPFYGLDLWTGFELSWINPKGKPQVAMAEFVLPCTTQFLIESKSFKLYLNSFNQTVVESQDALKAILENDLSKAAQGPISVTLKSLESFSQKNHSPHGICLDDLEIETDVYSVQPAFLQTKEGEVEEMLYSRLLKSNCLATGQPDWGSLFVHYSGPKIDHKGLLKYIISYRMHSGFHEDCVEQIYCDMMERCRPKHLSVCARYTRRGGLDINPFRSNKNEMPNWILYSDPRQ